jgi:PTH1 family peptidyl-tRNA hydrolase
LYLISGLGNIGQQYYGTRHNIGFEVVDYIADICSLIWQPSKSVYYFAEGDYKGINFVLIKPTTYMNNSGIAVAEALELYQVDISNLLIVCDDYNLPLGKVRLRPKGSDGGHKGLYSIIYHLMTDNFPRLRIGIGNSFIKGDESNFVLSVFNKTEELVIKEIIKHSSEVIKSFIEAGIQRTMTVFN